MKTLKMKHVIRAVLPITDAYKATLRGIEIRMIGTEEELIGSGAVKLGEFPGPRRGSCRAPESRTKRRARHRDGRRR